MPSPAPRLGRIAGRMDRHLIQFPTKHLALREDVHQLGVLVGEMLREQGGSPLYDLVEGDRLASIGRRDDGGADDLAQLFDIVVAVDEQKRRRLFARQASIPRQDHPAIGARRPDQAVAGEVPAIDDVTAEDAQPLGKPSQHAVGGEGDRFIAHLARLLNSR